MSTEPTGGVAVGLNALLGAYWQPMPAPTGVAILIAREDGSVEGVEAADNDYDWQPFDSSKPRLWGISRVTHWMPMPLAPNAAAHATTERSEAERRGSRAAACYVAPKP